MTIEEFCRNLDNKLSEAGEQQACFDVITTMVGQAFKAATDEVAIFAIDGQSQMVSFLLPQKLRRAGKLPLSSHNALVVKTITENRPSLDNSFSSTPHAFVFEHFKLAVDSSPQPIQKIMSAPIVVDEHVAGVIQISRKGTTAESAGADFSASQLSALVCVSAAIAPHLSKLQ